MRFSRVRFLAPLAIVAVLSAVAPPTLWAGTGAPPPFDWIDGMIRYVQRAAVPTVILVLMCSALGWLVAKNSSGVVEFMGRGLLVLSVLLGAGAILAAVGFQGGVT